MYDGHGTDGHDAAAFAKKNLPNQIAKYLRQMRVKEYQKILKAEGKSLKGSYKPELWPTLSPHAYEMACRKGFLECNKAMHDDPSVSVLRCLNEKMRGPPTHTSPFLLCRLIAN